MPKTKISEFSATPANNTDIDSINISEGCAPSGINDAIRELMAQLKDFQTGAVGDSFNGPVGTTTAAAGAFTTLSSTGNTTLGDASGDSVTINGTATFANANPTLSAGTANGVAYLNGSKVVTSGSALTFSGSALGVNATSTDASMSIQALTANYASVLSLVANNDNGAQYNNISSSTSGGTVHWRIGGVAGTSQLPFSVGGSEGMRLTSTGLGIGTSSPSVKLDVRSGATPTAALLDTTAATAYSGGSFFSGANLIIRSGANATGNGSGIRFASSNNGSLEGMFGWVQNASTYGDFVWQGYNGSYTERMRLDSSGNLGLGVTPSAWVTLKGLEIAGLGNSISGYPADAGIYVSSNAYYGSGGWKYAYSSKSATLYSGEGGLHNWKIAPSGTAGNAITFTQAMSLTAGGDLLVGNTGPANGRIDVTSNSGGTAINVRARSGNDYGFIQFKSNDDATVWGEVYGTSSIRLYCDAGGTNGVYLTSGATSWTANSDERLKENLVPIENGLSKVCSLRSVIGNFISDETKTKKPFLIAQDVLAVLPEAVSSGAIPKSEDTTEYLGVAYTEVIPLLVAAIKEQQAIIDSLKARLDAANL